MLTKLFCICVLGSILVACESKVTRDAKLDGMNLVDSNGKKWIARHSMGDCFFLYEVRNDGTINFE